MKKFQKTLAGFLSVSVLSLSAITALAADAENFRTGRVGSSFGEIRPISSEWNEKEQAYFNSFTGTVKEIRDFAGVEGSKYVLVENSAGETANIVIMPDTYFVNDAKITVGSVITGFYEANAPMLMIYPPQYKAEVVAVGMKGQNIKADRFDKDLVSADRSLKLNISDKTEIILQDGKAFDGELAGRKLIVVYGASTKSIPAQTTPTKIIVLFEKAVPPVHQLTPEEIAALDKDISSMDIIVDNQKIEAPAAYINDQGTIMVPLRAIAEALKFEVTWNGKDQSVMLGKGISLKIGEDNYKYMRTAPIQLGTAPVLIQGRTFVPLSFFKEVVRMNNAYVFESQIVIDNGEIMN